MRKFLAALLFTLLSANVPAFAAAPVWVQSQVDGHIANNGTTTYTFSLLHTFTSGHGLGGLIYFEAGTAGYTILSITDNASNTYTILDSHLDAVGTTNYVYMFGNANVSGTPTTITFTASSAPGGTFQYMWADEVSGASSIDAHILGVNSTATNTLTSGNITPSTANDLLLGYTSPDSGSTPTAGSGFTLRINDTTLGGFSESQTLSSSSPVAATFTVSPTAGTGIVGAIAYEPPTSGTVIHNLPTLGAGQ